jgi:hypothetical protein
MKELHAPDRQIIDIGGVNRGRPVLSALTISTPVFIIHRC